MSVHHLFPPEVAGLPVEYYQGEVETGGGYEVVVWQNEHRDAGVMVRCAGVADVHRLLREIEEDAL